MQADDGTAASSNASKGKSADKKHRRHNQNKADRKRHSAKKSKSEPTSKSKKTRGSEKKKKGSSRKYNHESERDKERNSKSKSTKEQGERRRRKGTELPQPESGAETSPTRSQRRKHRKNVSKHAAAPSSTSSRKKKRTSVFRKIYRKLAGPRKKKGRKEKSRRKAEEQISPAKKSETESARSPEKIKAAPKDAIKGSLQDKDQEVVARTGSPKKKGIAEAAADEKDGAPGTAEVPFSVSEDQTAKTMTAKDIADKKDGKMEVTGRKVSEAGAEAGTSTAGGSTTEASEQKELPEIATSPKKSAITESKPEAPGIESKEETDRQVSAESTSKEEAAPGAPGKVKLGKAGALAEVTKKRGASAGDMGMRKSSETPKEKRPSAAPSEESIIRPQKMPIKEEKKRESSETEPRTTSFVCPETRSKHDGVVAVDWHSLQSVFFPEY